MAVFERNDRVGKKLIATGNGQGNLTNANLSAQRYRCEKRVIDAFLQHENNINLSLEVDAIFANSETGNFNARNHAVRNYFGDFFTDKTGDLYILNAVKVFEDMYKKFLLATT